MSGSRLAVTLRVLSPALWFVAVVAFAWGFPPFIVDGFEVGFGPTAGASVAWLALSAGVTGLVVATRPRSLPRTPSFWLSTLAVFATLAAFPFVAIQVVVAVTWRMETSGLFVWPLLICSVLPVLAMLYVVFVHVVIYGRWLARAWIGVLMLLALAEIVLGCVNWATMSNTELVAAQAFGFCVLSLLALYSSGTDDAPRGVGP